MLITCIWLLTDKDGRIIGSYIPDTTLVCGYQVIWACAWLNDDNDAYSYGSVVHGAIMART